MPKSRKEQRAIRKEMREHPQLSKTEATRIVHQHKKG